MRILITGASGFIGRNLILALYQEHDIIALYHTNPTFQQFCSQRKIKSNQVDLQDSRAVQELTSALGEFDLMILLAANGDPTLSVIQPATDLNQTLLVTLNSTRYFKAKRVIFFSSGAVYDGLEGYVSPQSPVRPHLPYAISKLAAEQYCEFFCKERNDHGDKSELLILRFFGAFGPYEPERKVYTRLIQTLISDDKAPIILRGDGSNLIDAMFIADLVKIMKKVIAAEWKSTIYDLCQGDPITIRELALKVCKILGVLEDRIQFRGKTAESICFIGRREIF